MTSAANILEPTPDAIARAARALREGKLVAFPTETVYGLGADATSDRAVAEIFAAKGRPSFNPLIVHLPDLEAVEKLVRVDERARKLAAAFWPGALTLVLPRRADCPISELASAGLDTLAVRLPAHPLALALLRAAGRPIAAPSANPSGRISPTTASHVAAGLGEKVAIILDGGPCKVGVESTVVGLAGETPVLLRPGGVSAEEIEAVIGPLARPGADEEIRKFESPGMMESHYAPALPLRMNAAAAAPGEALLGFGPDVADATLNLSATGDTVEAAANLFAMLHQLDRPDYAGIAVSPIPDEGLGRAINDRLRRAAAPRPQAGKKRK